MKQKNDGASDIAMLEVMALIRRYEETIVELSGAGQGPGTCTSVGQEASAAGVVRALAPQDLILTNHRSAGHLLARGADPGRMLAEVLGRSTGYCKGKSGHLHISAKELGVILTSTIVGGELSLATGVALSRKMLAEDNGIVVCFFGDGAACEGIFHESLNLAAVWDLPILFVCENNEWQAFVHRRETMPFEHVRTWAASHGVANRSVDGNDVVAVHKAAREAAAHVRTTGKPFFLENLTYRMRGHFEPDDQAYVDPAELARWRERDPIVLFEGRLRDSGVLGDEAARQLAHRVEQRIGDALAFAQASPFPAVGELFTDVYASTQRSVS